MFNSTSDPVITAVTTNEIARQRELGWPDFHPEDYCHKCGQQNIKAWTSPEWGELVGTLSGILCPVCFAEHDPDAIWVVTRWHPPDADQVALLAACLRTVTSLADDADRVARCLVDAGWSKLGGEQ